MFKPYGKKMHMPRVPGMKHFKHEMHEPISEHLSEVVGMPHVPKPGRVRLPRPRRY